MRLSGQLCEPPACIYGAFRGKIKLCDLSVDTEALADSDEGVSFGEGDVGRGVGVIVVADPAHALNCVCSAEHLKRVDVSWFELAAEDDGRRAVDWQQRAVVKYFAERESRRGGVFERLDHLLQVGRQNEVVCVKEQDELTFGYGQEMSANAVAVVAIRESGMRVFEARAVLLYDTPGGVLELAVGADEVFEVAYGLAGDRVKTALEFAGVRLVGRCQDRDCRHRWSPTFSDAGRLR